MSFYPPSFRSTYKARHKIELRNYIIKAEVVLCLLHNKSISSKTANVDINDMAECCNNASHASSNSREFLKTIDGAYEVLPATDPPQTAPDTCGQSQRKDPGTIRQSLTILEAEMLQVW